MAGGRAGDLFGRRRIFRAGIIVFAAASMAGGFAQDGTTLLAARIVQGCGAAIAVPGALSLLATTFPAGPARTRALGIYGAMGGLGSVAGLLLSRAPMLPPRVVRDRNRGGANTVMFLLGTGTLAMFYLLTLYYRWYGATRTRSPRITAWRIWPRPGSRPDRPQASTNHDAPSGGDGKRSGNTTAGHCDHKPPHETNKKEPSCSPCPSKLAAPSRTVPPGSW